MGEYKIIQPTTENLSFANFNNVLKSMLSQIPGIEIITPKDDDPDFFIFTYNGYDNAYIRVTRVNDLSYTNNVSLYVFRNREATENFKFPWANGQTINYTDVASISFNKDTGYKDYGEQFVKSSYYITFGENNLFINLTPIFRVMFWTEPSGNKYMTVFKYMEENILRMNPTDSIISNDHLVCGSFHPYVSAIAKDLSIVNRGLLLPMLFNSINGSMRMYSESLIFTNSRIVGNVAPGAIIYINAKKYMKIYGDAGNYNIVAPV